MKTRRRSFERQILALMLVAAVAAIVHDVDSVSPISSTTAHAIAQPTDAYPASISADSRYLVDDKGRPYLIHGDAAWSLVVELDQSSARQYLNDRQAKGFNVLLVNVIENKFSSNPPRNAVGDAPFVGAAFTTSPNEAYFEHVDWLVEQAQQRGITLMLVPAYLGYPGSDQGWSQQVVNTSTAQMRSYGEFLGDRYRDHPNIIWAIGGDKNPTQAERSRLEALAAGLRATSPGHLMTAHTVTGYNADEVWGSSSWLDLNNVYTYDAPADATADAYGASPTRPVFFMEGIYEDEQGVSDTRIRTQAWASLLSGASGQIFGNNPIWHFSSGGLYPTGQTWQQAVDGRGSKNMSHIRTLFDGIPWHRMTPDRPDRFLVSGERTGTNRAVASMSSGDGLGVVYVPSARTVELDLGSLTSTSTLARWFDPTSGTYRNIGTFSSNGRRSFTTPGNNSTGDRDWVLVLSDSATPPTETEAGVALVPVDPARLLETRAGEKTIDRQFQGIGRVRAGGTVELTVTGRADVPADADAAMLNITAVNPSAAGFLTVYPCGSKRPLASNVNYVAGEVAPNAVLAKIGNGGKVCIYTLAATDLLADVNGYVPEGGSVETLDPARLLETRAGEKTIDRQFQGIGRVRAGGTVELTVTGRADVPADADAAMLNITAVNPSAAGFLTVYPCGSKRPLASNVNYVAGEVAPNAVLAKIGNGGKVCIYTLAATDLLADVNGYVPEGGSVETLDPARLLETRAGEKTIDRQFQGIGRVRAGGTVELTVTGRADVPADADAAMLNITAVNPSAAGFLTVYPCGSKRPLASNVNYVAGEVAPNAVLAKIGNGGKVCIYTLAATDLLADVNGYVPEP